jgi:hypothetical protein
VITSFTECTTGVSHFEGTDTNNNTFIVDVDDNDELSTADTFQIRGVDQNGQPYANGPLPLSDGNIQAHGFSCQ